MSATKRRFNPHPKGSELARAYEAGRRAGRRSREALEDLIMADLGNVSEVIEQLRTRYQLRVARFAELERRRRSSPRVLDLARCRDIAM
jgi:hypothetical protein